MKIKIKYHTNVYRIKKLEQGNWYDLSVVEDYDLNKGDFKLLDLGVSMELPGGYEAYLVPRSSAFKVYGIIQTNHIGIIDNSFSSDEDIWKFPAYATRDTIIIKGTRICQFRIQKIQPDIEFEEVKTLGNKKRGSFGSTGVNCL